MQWRRLEPAEVNKTVANRKHIPARVGREGALSACLKKDGLKFFCCVSSFFMLIVIEDWVKLTPTLLSQTPLPNFGGVRCSRISAAA
jgi:hypothetical protein